MDPLPLPTLRITPAMTAAFTDRVGDIAGIVKLLEERRKTPGGTVDVEIK